MTKVDPLPRTFYRRDTKKVAKDLLGTKLVHKDTNKVVSGTIVETEAYYGPKDPASRASNGKTKISTPMWSKPGASLVYMVHAYWLFNIVTEEQGTPGAVLIRALKPGKGIELMKKRRETDDLHNLCSGPGKLTEALGITNEHQNVDVTEASAAVVVTQGDLGGIQIGTSHRIGVSEDLPQELRFYIEGSPFLSQ